MNETKGRLKRKDEFHEKWIFRFRNDYLIENDGVENQSWSESHVYQHQLT